MTELLCWTLDAAAALIIVALLAAAMRIVSRKLDRSTARTLEETRRFIEHAEREELPRIASAISQAEEGIVRIDRSLDHVLHGGAGELSPYDLAELSVYAHVAEAAAGGKESVEVPSWLVDDPVLGERVRSDLSKVGFEVAPGTEGKASVAWSSRKGYIYGLVARAAAEGLLVASVPAGRHDPELLGELEREGFKCEALEDGRAVVSWTCGYGGGAPA